MSMVEVGIIGGTGRAEKGILKAVKRQRIRTPYGHSPELILGEIAGRRVAFLPRHGGDHSLPPHMINYRANIYALRSLGVKRVISLNSVGSINPNLKPGDFVVPHDFVDFTKNRATTFYDGEVVHVDMSQPYCPELRKVLIKVSRGVNKAVYLCTEGPRFETPAEIRVFAKLGCDVVGMVGVPEVTLAREAEMCYASLCTVTNYAAGISKGKLTLTEVMEIAKHSREKLKETLHKAIEALPERYSCDCRDALRGARSL